VKRNHLWSLNRTLDLYRSICDGTSTLKLLSSHILLTLQVPPGQPTRQRKDTGSIVSKGQTIQTAPIVSQS
jgi:hypothetical protein